MRRFHFSLERVRNFQMQKVSLAEIRCSECRARYDRALSELQNISAALEEASRELRAKSGDVQAILSQRNLVDRLWKRKGEALQAAAGLEKELREALDELTAAKTRLEGYETLRESEKKEFAELNEKAATNELMDGLLSRQWLERNET